MHTRSRKRWLLAAALLLLLLGGLAAWYFRPDAEVARVKDLRQELFSEAARKLPAAERRQKWEAFRQEEAKLTPAQRKEVWEEARKQRKKEVERYFTLSKAEKTKWLDQQIDRMESARRERQASGGGNGGFSRGGAGGGPGRGGAGGSQGGGTFASGTGPGANGTDGSGGTGAPPSAEDRERRRKERLDSTTPEERAQFDQLRKDLATRRAQRGLPPSPFGPR